MNCVSCISKYKQKKEEEEEAKKNDNYKILITPPTPPKKIKNDLINIKNDIKINKEK